MNRVHQSSQADPGSILIVLPTWVGDFVMATPTLRAIRARFASAEITFLCEPNLHELIDGCDWMNDRLEWPAKQNRSLFHREFRELIKELRSRRFDWAVLLTNSFRSALVAKLSGARHRIGYDRDARGLLLTDRLPVSNRRGSSGAPTVSIPAPPGRYIPLPLNDYLADLAEAIGCPRPDDKLELFTTPEGDQTVQQRLASLGIDQKHPLVVLSPGAKYGAAKCWPPERFAAAADRLIDAENAAVVITCGPGEEPIARKIEEGMMHKGFVLANPGLGLGALKSLIARSDLLICNDAGPRHFAKAFGIPVVTIFGPTHPQWTATSYEMERIVRIDVDCGPCQQRICPLGHMNCMTGVTVDAVVDAATELMETAASLPSYDPSEQTRQHRGTRPV